MQISKAMIVAACFGALLSSQPALAKKPHTRSAASIVGEAEVKAASAKKNVLVLFHASWCSWCHKLDDFLNRPEIAPLIDSNYVTVHIVVQESDDKKDLDNPGGDALLERLGGKDLGIPYFAILSPSNETLAVSKNDKGENIGYPGSKDEIPLFMKMLRSTSAHLTEADATLIETKLYDAGKKIDDDQALYIRLYTPIRDAFSKHDYQAALSGSEDIIASHRDQAASAYMYRYEALLHVDESKALSEIGRPLGVNKRKQADVERASLIVNQDGLSDRAYQAALSILLQGHADASVKWYEQRELALAYARVHKIKEAVQFQDKAIEGAKTAKAPQRLIDELVKSETDWQKTG
jgi:thiol-disulfide isomerase/thioredoxin